MQSRAVPFNYCYKWLICSIKIGEKNYSLLLASGLVFYISTILVSFIPFIGGVTSPILGFLFGTGTMRLLNKVRTTGDATFDDFLQYSFDKTLFEKVIPMFATLVVFGGLQVAAGIANLVTLTFLLSLIGQFLMVFFIFTAYRMVQQNSTDWKSCLRDVVSGFGLNIFTWIVSGFIAVLFLLGCFLLCIFPFILYGIPMTQALSHLVYSSIYEGLDIDQEIARWVAVDKKSPNEPIPPPQA